MNPKEMHIALNQGLQQIAANATFKFLPEEYDFILTKMQDRMVQMQLKPKTDEKGRLTGGFEATKLAADFIRTLIVNSFDMVPYRVDGETYKCFLPADYAYLLSDWSYTRMLCDGDPVLTPTKTQLFIKTLRQDNPPDGAGPFFVTATLKMDGYMATIPDDLPYGNDYAGLATKDQAFQITPFFRSKLRNIYWEKFDNLEFPSHYILVDATPFAAGNNAWTVDGLTTSVSSSSTVDLAYWKTELPTKYRDNRLTSSDSISALNAVPFWKSSHYSPISELGDGVLYIYGDSSFIVTGAGLSYIRQCRPISLSLNLKSELPEKFHPQLVDLAVEYLKGRLNAPQEKQLATDDIERRVFL